MGAGGRPTDYRPEYVQMVDEYIKTCGREQTKLPKRIDIAILLDCDEDTLNNWAKQHPEFLGALTRVDNFQKSQLMDDGLYGGKEINSNVAIFLLEANHNMVRTEKKLIGNPDGSNLFENLSDEQLNQIIDSKIRKVGVITDVAGEGAEDQGKSA